MRRSLAAALSTGAVIGAVLAPAAASAANNPANHPTKFRQAASITNAPPAGDPDTTVTFTVNANGVGLGMTAPDTVDLAGGTGVPGGTRTGPLGVVTVTDARAISPAAWEATAVSTDFTTGGGAGNSTIPFGDASYAPGTITPTNVTTVGHTITFTATAQNVVDGSAGDGSNSASWNPTITVNLPATVVAGNYTSTLTQAVS